MKKKYTRNKTMARKGRCGVCGRFVGSRGWVLFEWKPTHGIDTMIIEPEEIEKRKAGVICDTCHQLANGIN